MSDLKILVPYNFSPPDQKAVDFVVRTFTGREAVAVTLFHAYTPVPEIQMRGSPIMEKMSGNLAYLGGRIRDLERNLQAVADRMVVDGFAADRVAAEIVPRKKDVAGEIIEMVQQRGFSLVVLTRKPGRVTRFFTGSVFHRVISALKGTAVCVIS